jgi:hypothetical protein
MRFLLTIALLAAAPAVAQEPAPDAAPAPSGRSFQPPPGCTAYLTVQMASCTVSHHFTCSADPEGWQRRVDMDQEGITYAGAIDAETQWMESYHFLSGEREFLAPDPADPASFTELTTKGQDSFDFVTSSPEAGPTRFVGGDRLIGETVTIDGVTLDRSEYQITAYAPDGSVMWRSTGNEFISRDWRMFLSGTSSIVVGDQVEETDDTPMEFIFPEERGFLSVNPKYGCGAMDASFTPSAEEALR